MSFSGAQSLPFVDRPSISELLLQLPILLNGEGLPCPSLRPSESKRTVAAPPLAGSSNFAGILT